MRSQCQHTNSRLMEYRVISSDSHLSKHYALIYICTRYVLELSFILFQSVINFFERELFPYPEEPLQMPLSAHTSREHWSSDIRSSYWWRSLLLIMVSYSHLCNINILSKPYWISNIIIKQNYYYLETIAITISLLVDCLISIT